MSSEEALSWFRSLPAVDAAAMAGTWRGKEISTGHPLDGLLGTCGWYGKRFCADGSAHPLLFRDGSGGVVAIDPKKLPLGLVLKMPGLAKSGAAAFLFRRAIAHLKTERPAAHLERRSFEGVESAAMVYENQPIIDHFRQSDDGRLLGMMQIEGSPDPYFFVLQREDA
nr:GXWXG domain-containing protein [Afifella sp. IM 167]